MSNKQASSYYAHFAASERSEVDYLVGLFNRLLFKSVPILTPFLDPRERFMLKMIVGHEAQLTGWGGYPHAERQRVYLTPNTVAMPAANFKVIPIEISYPNKYAQLTHSDILGALANMGIALPNFGDIITDGHGHWQFFVVAQLQLYLCQQLTRIGHVHVTLNAVAEAAVIIPQDDSLLLTTVAAAMRLDAVLASITHQSRGQIKKLISQHAVKLNWHNVTGSNIMLTIGDVISLRHFGRVEINQFGATKKEKYRVVYKLWQTKNTRS